MQAKDATSAVKIVLAGGAVPATHTAPSFLTMAPYANQLTDEQVAQVVNFIQTSWGNRGGTTTASQVAKIRKLAVPVKAVGAESFAPDRTGTVPLPMVRARRIE